MNITALIPLIGPGMRGSMGMGMIGGLLNLLFLALIIGGIFFLMRRTKLGAKFGPGAWTRPPAPEDEARKVLAERFARGDISVEEFMERASALNWTPGVDPNAKPR